MDTRFKVNLSIKTLDLTETVTMESLVYSAELAELKQFLPEAVDGMLIRWNHVEIEGGEWVVRCLAKDFRIPYWDAVVDQGLDATKKELEKDYGPDKFECFAWNKLSRGPDDLVMNSEDYTLRPLPPRWRPLKRARYRYYLHWVEALYEKHCKDSQAIVEERYNKVVDAYNAAEKNSKEEIEKYENTIQSLEKTGWRISTK